jgi:cruciform cutting endonuclease 1
MARKPRTVTAKALQTLLARIGSPIGGTKDILHGRLQRDMHRPRLFDLRPEWKQRLSHVDPSSRKLRIMSTDMGIKNLAYCHVEVGYADGGVQKPRVEIVKWERLSLVDDMKGLRRPVPDEMEDETVDPYSLDILSQSAYHFLTRTALALAPDIVLIERQRWRSASSPAIQQWTVRVNTVEAMLWAILETLRTERLANISTDYEVYAVDPGRVGQYWLGQTAKALAEKDDEDALVLEFGEDEESKAKIKKMGRSKVEKKAKIAILRSWLADEPASTATSTPKLTHPISFTIGPDAVTAREALCLPVRPPRGKNKKKKKEKKNKSTDDGSVVEDDVVQEQDMKVDDITDCFMQAAAWVAWETNRLQLLEVCKNIGEDGAILALDEEVLSDMVESVGEA